MIRSRLNNRRQLMSEDFQTRLSSNIQRKHIAETGLIPLGLQLLQDSYPFQVLDRKVTVAEGLNGQEVPIMRVAGLIQMGDHENANGRIYSTKDVLTPAIEKIQEDIGSRAVVGEYDHPTDAKIHLDRLSHLMTKVWMDGRKVYGEAEVLHKLPCGACLRGLFEHKIRVCISSRGVGDMEIVENNHRETFRVLPGFEFVTWDVVSTPSVSNAILNIQEGLSRRLKPIKQQQHQFSTEVYENKLVSEINKFFGLK